MDTDLEQDIQGNVVTGFNKDHQRVLIFQFSDDASARRWLRELTGDVATSQEVRMFNDLFRLVRARRDDHREVVEATWTQLLLTSAGLVFIGVPQPEVSMLGGAFASGMKAQASVLGDRDESDPSNWIEPYKSATIHGALVIASDDNDDLKEEVAHVRGEAERRGVLILHEEHGHVLQGSLRGHEHFGFKDGISQPAVEGVDDIGGDASVAVPLGEFVLGHEGGKGPSEPPEWARNGSLVAFRRLRQDVAGFRALLEATAPSLGEPPAKVGAQLVGRWPSGAPLAHATETDDPSQAEPPQNNAFDYADDPEGVNTPRFAHIRKVFPRHESLNPPPGESDARRILRRGIPYGEQLAASPSQEESDQDRGLLFFCCQASIEEQFQFIQSLWANNPNFPVGAEPAAEGYTPFPGEPADGPDPVIGQHHGAGTDTLRRTGQSPASVQLGRQLVTTTGGEYFFAPGLSGLRVLGVPMPASAPGD